MILEGIEMSAARLFLGAHSFFERHSVALDWEMAT